MANPYPIEIADAGDGSVKVAGKATFTDPANQPGGGSLPAQWTVDPDTGALTITLTGAAGDHDYADALTINNADGSAILTLDSSGEVSISATDADAGPLNLFANVASQGTHLLSLQGSGSPAVIDIENQGRVRIADKFMLRGDLIHSAPADGEFNAGDIALWFDQTNGAAKLMIKGKSADGTVVTGEVALT